MEKSDAKGGWTLRWPESVDRFGTKGRVKGACHRRRIPFETSFMALGDGPPSCR